MNQADKDGRTPLYVANRNDYHPMMKELLAIGLAAYTAPLTGVYNKRYLLRALEYEFNRARALHANLSLLFLDLDHFKKINDTYGHDAGDYVLKEFSTSIQSQYLRSEDTFARYGGEEFVILLANTPVKSALEIAKQILNSVKDHPFIYAGKRLSLTVSLGIAEVNPSVDSPQTLLRLADQALYKAKKLGRNRVVVAQP